jgi:AhpD family alkylhydroperoxidase
VFLLQYLVPIKPSRANGLVAKVYSQIKQDFGRIVEPFTLHSPIPSILAGAWMAARESELVGHAPRSVKEAIAASVSKLNQCPYCVDAHTIMIRATGEKRTAKLIAKEQYDEIRPDQTKKIVKWALSTLSPKSKLINMPPFTKELAAELIGTAVFYHYINPLATIFLGNSPLPIPFFKSQMKPIVSRLFKKAVNSPKLPGDSLALLPAAKLPEDLSWAKESYNVSEAYARFAEAFSKLEKTVIPKQTQQIVNQYLDNWPGETQKFGTERLEEITFHLKPEFKIATSIALMTIFSPYKITQKIIKEFRNFFPLQEQLLGIAAWASFTRARKIGQNLIS